MTTRAAIYARISEDRYGEGEGVDRQREACEKLAADRGLDLVAVFEDNDRSAMHGKRPAYDAMTAAVERGEVDVVLVLRTDRLYRKLSELLPLTEVLKKHNVPVYSVKGGDVDLSTADGRLRANIMGSVSQHESEVKGERISDAAEQRARRGRFPGGRRRFGYEHRDTRTVFVRDRADPTAPAEARQVPTGPLVLVPAEAEAIAEGYRAILRGATIESVARDWRSRQLVGPRGARFTGVAVRDVLLRPMNAGLAFYHGEEVGDMEVPAIVDQESWRAVKAILTDPARRSGVGRPAISLLSKVLRCAVCGGGMSAAVKTRPNGMQDRVYRCRAIPDKLNGTTGAHVQRIRHKLDAAIEDEMVAFLVDNAERLRRPVTATSGKVSKAAVEAEKLRGRLAGYQAAAATMDPADYAAATKAIRASLAAVERQIVVAVGTPATAALVRSDNIQIAWAESSTDEKRTVIAETIERIEVARGISGPKDQTMVGVKVYWKN